MPRFEVGPIAVAATTSGDRFAIATHLRTPENPFPAGPVGRIRICDSRTGRVLTTISVADIPRAMQFSNDGASLYWGHDGDPYLHVTDTGTGVERHVFRLPPGALRGQMVPGRGGTSPVSRVILIAGASALIATSSQTRASVELWELSTSSLFGSTPTGSASWSLAASDDGRRLAVGGREGVQVFDVAVPPLPQQVFATSNPSTVPATPASGPPATLIPPGEFGAGAYRLGAGITRPGVVSQPRPPYPDEAMHRKLQGRVLLEAVVREDGSVGAVRVTQSLDSKYGLDASAVATLRRWRFTPARDTNGQPVAVVVPIEMDFRLH